MSFNTQCLFMMLIAPLSLAAPYIPQSESEIIKVFTYSDEMREINLMRKQLALRPDNYLLLDKLLSLYISEGRKKADPRYFGYAEALLKPYLKHNNLPDYIFMHWADILQHRHDFDQALQVLDQLAKNQSINQQVYLMRAASYLSRGEYQQALESCKSLILLASHLVTIACVTQVKSQMGKLLSSFELLQRTVQRYKNSNADVLRWALSLLGDMSVRLGQYDTAEAYYLQGLDLEQADYYLLSRYADLLLKQKKYSDVITLLENYTFVDSLLLRLSLASKKINTAMYKIHITQLAATYRLNERRGEVSHLRDQAIFYLDLLDERDKAIELARQNWLLQKEPEDMKLLLRISLLTENKTLSEDVLTWLSEHSVEDIEINQMKQRLARMQE